MRRWWTWSGPTALAVAASPVARRDRALAQKRGGVVRIANLGEPPTLDAHWTTATLTEVLTNHLYEGLYALDEGYRPIPMLAEALPTVSPDGLTYTIRLREDQVPQRQGDDVGRRRPSFGAGCSSRSTGRRSAPCWRTCGRREVRRRAQAQAESAAVEVELAAPNNFGAIYPKEIAEKFPPAEKAPSSSGRGRSSCGVEAGPAHPDGPLRRLQAASEKASGYGGAKTVWVDEIRWIPVPTSPPAWPRWRPASSTSPTTSTSTRSTGCRRRERPAGRGQAVLLARRGPQQERA